MDFGDVLALGAMLSDDCEEDTRRPAKQPATKMVTPQYDWQNKEFQDACEAIRVDFYKRHPEITRAPGNFAKLFPEKDKAIGVLDRLGELNRIHPKEYVVLFNAIYDF